jgi:Protein of unknown function (DUF1573)
MIKRFIIPIFFIFFTFITEGVSQQISKPKVTPKSVPSHQLKTPVRKNTVPSEVRKVASIHFDKQKVDFGTIKEDAVFETSFEFTNTGNADLIIIDAEATCGCTLPTIPKEPIKPGGKAKINVKYTALNKVGPQKPVITVITNSSPSSVKLQLEGWVEQIPGGVAKN